jgi:hypothetical protein
MTFSEPVYAQNVILSVVIHNTFSWYITEREYWYLDITKYERALQTYKGNRYSADFGNYSTRFNIPILNENTADDFLAHIENFRVPCYILSQMMLNKANTLKNGDDLLDFIPCFLVKFDQRHFFSMYPEMIRFELYVPDGWKGSRQDFRSEIPDEEKYWMVNGQDLFTIQI